MSMQGREALEADLQQFLTEHRLDASWHYDGALLRLAHPQGVNAAVVMSFDPEFWGSYDKCDGPTQESARANLVQRLEATYDQNSQAAIAQEVRATLAILASD